MAGMCYGLSISETEAAAPAETSSKSGRRRMGIHQFNFAPTNSALAPPNPEMDSKTKRRKTEDNDVISVSEARTIKPAAERGAAGRYPRLGMTSVCGRRRDMEDAVSIRPDFCRLDTGCIYPLHFFGVFDGHGCSHVATRCKDRMHEIMRDEYGNGGFPWEILMSRSFARMDKEASDRHGGGGGGNSAYTCRCELRMPQCDAVGSTAVVAVVAPDKIVVSNCGDSRAVLCRNGTAIPLSADHKPDRTDELNRIGEAGGRVIFWDVPRVLGVLSMSRAIGDNYLKPYVIAEPEVTITDRTAEDECLILASDGLWDVVSNETACRVARMCLEHRKPRSDMAAADDQGCSDASALLTKLALARRSTDNVTVVVVDLRNL